jgi:hypothetical protein
MVKYTRNIQGYPVQLELIDIDPDEVKLDINNPRLAFTIRQLDDNQRTEAACTLLLSTQEEVEEIKRSIILSNGVQEPIYLRGSKVVADGNRRVAAMRIAKEEHPRDPSFQSMPAWVIPADVPETVIQDLMNEIHLGSVRGWAPYEKALQLRGLVDSGLIEEEVAERYRMSAREVKQHIAAVELMEREYFPITANPTAIEHRAKFSYFLEFEKNTKLQRLLNSEPQLEKRFAAWVDKNRITTGESVRRLPKILNSPEATKLLEVIGFDAAEEYLRQQHPEEQELYALLEKARTRLTSMTLTELHEAQESQERRDILIGLRDAAQLVLTTVQRISEKVSS